MVLVSMGHMRITFFLVFSLLLVVILVARSADQDTAGMLLFSYVPILQLLNRSAENHKHLSSSRIWVRALTLQLTSTVTNH